MIRKTVLLSLLFISTTCALALQTIRDLSLPNPTPIIESSEVTSALATDVTVSTDKTSASPEAARSSSTEASDDSSFVYLSVTTGPPDVLGIGNVSGFYGPGSWAAWFLSIVASWVRFIRGSEERFDPNTWLFLLGTNWAAVGLLRGIRLAQGIPQDSPTYDADLNSMQGSIAAAFTITFWGTFHASIQYLVTMRYCITMKTQRHRLWTLLLGMILPSIALLSSSGLIRTMNVPELYWQGMHGGARDFNLRVAAGTPYFIVPFSVWLLDYLNIPMMPTMIIDLRKRTVKKMRASRVIASLFRGIAYVSVVMLILSMMMLEATRNEKWLLGLLPLAPMYIYLLVLVAPIFWSIMLTCASAWYVVMTYVARSVKASQSCFFMPCAPQSINEEDQLFALFAGLLMFLGWEIIPVLVKGFRKRYRDRQESIEHMEERMRQLEMRRILRRFGWETSTGRTTRDPED
ncbi:hypothetical protein N7457_003234 [Penicillium paradoxum]|uniref:uncharacterized protein n=1 Tax=Penicillium paradoxum TaxID=176176 RepID=UPI00254813A7|nr:uncharacterized protein N7457_003234 [Penicillium paradoxum]KAJ5788244.1 hypothetical protein N7457_003234 [Penicillium paradoxum]